MCKKRKVDINYLNFKKYMNYNNNNINLTSLIRLLVINLKTTFICFALIFLFFLAVYFSFFKTQNYKYMLSSYMKPMSYIEFTKIFTFSDLDNHQHKKLIEFIDDKGDNLNKSRLTPLTIFYHFISILEREYDKKFDKALNIPNQNKNKFLHHNKKWNNSGAIYSFNIDVYGNDSIYLEKSFNEVIDKSESIFINDILNYLKKYEIQNINDTTEIKKIIENIKLLEKENIFVRISSLEVNKIINLNTLYLSLILLASLALSIGYILIREDIRLIKKRK